MRLEHKINLSGFFRTPMINFNDLCNVLNKLGFQQRIKGSHHIFFKNDIDEIINIQPRLNKAKEYQVKQVREIIVKYKLLDK